MGKFSAGPRVLAKLCCPQIARVEAAPAPAPSPALQLHAERFGKPPRCPARSLEGALTTQVLITVSSPPIIPAAGTPGAFPAIDTTHPRAHLPKKL